MALLSGGSAAPAFGGGAVIAPMNIYLAGRAITEVGADVVPVEEIAIKTSQAWLNANLHALDPERHVRFHVLIHPGSQELRTLFLRRGPDRVPLANDTSIGVGHAPLSALERIVLTIEKNINGRDRRRNHPAWGEDVKIMGIWCGNHMQITVACAMIGQHLTHIDDYLGEKVAVGLLVKEQVAAQGFPSPDVAVNAADDLATGSIYLTVTGTSAEAGDDGQVGRSNRVNGLITPCRPMTLEAPAGKNPVTHVGKVYTVLARNIADTLVRELPDVASVHCLMVSEIGTPISRPAVLQLKLATRDRFPLGQLRQRIEEITAERLAYIPRLIEDFVAGTIEVF